MADYKNISLDINPETKIAKLTLRRPEKLNSITREMGLELVDAIEKVSDDDNARVLILTGEGRGFCSGADTGGMAGGDNQGPHSGERGAEEIRRGFKTAQAMILGLQRMEKPTIAMVNGAAVGAGFDLACACDIRIGTPKSRFMVAFVRIGLFPGYGGTWLYAKALGSISKAAELLFTGDFLEADEAKHHGLLNHLVQEEELESFTMDMASRIANGPPIAIRIAKLMLYKGLEFDLETAMKMAAAAETITLTSQDHREGVQAFREKRTPTYEGK